MDYQYQVIVVGAGPAGAMAARQLALAGIDVLLLERETLPREKTCAGAVSLRALELLDFPVHPVVEGVARGATVTHDGGRPINVQMDVPLAYLVERSHFDLLLAEQATRAGATLVSGAAVSGIQQDRSGVTVYSGNRAWRSYYVVAADGARSSVARLLGLGGGQPVAVTLAVHMPLPAHWPRTILRLDYGWLPFGYAWAFPKRERLALGVGSFRRGLALRWFLRRWLEENGVTPDPAYHWRGWPVPIAQGQRQRMHGRVLLAGDAAGLADPFTGEGIYAALKSGWLAAQVVREALLHRSRALTSYEALLKKEILAQHEMAGNLQRIFYPFSSVFHQQFQRNPRLLETALAVACGEAGYGDLLRQWRTAGKGVRGWRRGSRERGRALVAHLGENQEIL